MEKSIITVEHLRKEYPNATPLEDVSTEVYPGEVVSIIGPSGTGKSTFLRCLNLLEEPTSGRITVDGMCVTDPDCDISMVRRKMGMVFQSFNLFDNLTIIGNVMAAPVSLLHMPKDEARALGMELLERVGLAQKADNFPDELSGGQKQRAAIARAIAMRPKILLLDEPTSALDPTMVSEVLSVVRGLANEGMTMLIVTHEMRFAKDVSTRVLYMDEGGIYEDGSSKQIFENPTKKKTIAFIKRLKNFSAVIDSARFDFIGMMADMEQFLKDNIVPQTVALNLQHVFEELVMANLVKRLDEPFKIDLEIEFSDATGQVNMNLDYDGGEFDPFKDGEEISMTIVRKLSGDCKHSYDGINHVRIGFE